MVKIRHWEGSGYIRKYDKECRNFDREIQKNKKYKLIEKIHEVSVNSTFIIWSPFIKP